MEGDMHKLIKFFLLFFYS